MKNKIIIFATIFVFLISIMPISAFAVKDLHSDEHMHTKVLPKGYYKFVDLNYFIQEIYSLEEQNQYNTLATLGRGNVTLLDNDQIYLTELLKNSNGEIIAHTDLKIKNVASVYSNYENNLNVAYVSFTVSHEGVNANYWWEVSNQGLNSNVDSIDNYYIHVKEDTVVHQEFYYFVTNNFTITQVDFGTECDGSTCPATDSNFDNVCDDCGMVLTMSLRNTLYDYALWLAESKVTDGYNYYAIFKSSDTYYVHISKSHMSSPDGKVLEGDGIMYNRVTQSSDGTNGGSGWYNGFYNSYDEFVEANHTISNFKGALPLAVKILGVAGEQIQLKLPTLGGTITTLVLCGVGCLAFLMVLSLFGKRSLISRK